MSNKNLLLAARVIEQLGGNAKVAALCEVTPGAVSQWLHNGIPRTQLKFLKLLRPEVFDEPILKKTRARRPPPNPNS